MAKKSQPHPHRIKEKNMSSTYPDLTAITEAMGGLMETPAIRKAMANIALMPPINIDEQTPEPYRGFTFKPAYMGFRPTSNDLKLVLVAAKMEPQFVSLDKFIPLVENMDDARRGTIVLQNHSPASDKGPARPQVIARIVARNSAVNIIRGNPGVMINQDEDIWKRYSYQVDRSMLATYYLAAKLYLGNDELIRQLVAATEGMRSYEIRASNCEVDDHMLAANLIG